MIYTTMPMRGAERLRFDEALGCYLDGAVRCPSFPALLTGFRCDRLAVRPLPAVETLR